MIEQTAWRDRLEGQRKALAPLRLVAVLNRPPGDGGSDPILMRAEDGAQWWVKLLNNAQSPMVLVNEQIVAGCGSLIGVSTCEVAIVEVPDALAGPFHGVQIKAGLAHGSRDVPSVINRRLLTDRARDDNARRHVGMYALHDWCWGSDVQWLYAQKDDHKVYSHDHGHFFPCGPAWNSDTKRVLEQVDVPHELWREQWSQADNAKNLDVPTIIHMADQLRGVKSKDLVDVLSGIPESWPVSEEELEILGFFLERRAPQVADRLMELAEMAGEK